MMLAVQNSTIDTAEHHDARDRRAGLLLHSSGQSAPEAPVKKSDQANVVCTISQAGTCTSQPHGNMHSHRW
jgi:hypothetical protein